MGKKKSKKLKTVAAPKKSIEELMGARNGGQDALRGYSYQFLYSCFLILESSSIEDSFQLEGVEDIDYIRQLRSSAEVTHIQLKYSTNRQDASFLKDVLKNFLQAYLIDPNRTFRLVYDFSVAKGRLQNLFQGNIAEADKIYWEKIINEIKLENSSWNWLVFNFADFFNRVDFEYVKKNELEDKIEKALIVNYEIMTDNISLYANSIKIKCFEAMEHRGIISKTDVDSIIQNVKIDISKGDHNPAHSWISKIHFESSEQDGDKGYYEGKKATPSDIASRYPIRRFTLEKEIEKSIEEYCVTVIKASSGQGKSTLALQCIYNLHSDYCSYQLLWCNEKKEIGNIVQYFKARIKLGEKVLILIDNLDNHFEYWNALAIQLKNELKTHYKILITSRESDWFNYCGDLSSIQSINTIKPTLVESEARDIFDLLKKTNRLHSSIDNWQTVWNRIADKQLLIEYMYLLTHGAMLSERISSQIHEVAKTQDGKVKCEILRKVCMADICGTKISVDKLCLSLEEKSSQDVGELIKSLEAEFLIHMDSDKHYIEGLHPVRSKHVFDRLHEYVSVEKTAISLIGMTKAEDIPILFSHFPELGLRKAEFCENVADILWDENDYSKYMLAIKGAFSGSVLQYYKENEKAFLDADEHGGLFVITTEKCPFASFNEFGIKVSALDDMRCIMQGNANIEYLCELRDRMPEFDINDSFVYCLCSKIYIKINGLSINEIRDIESYSSIIYWLYIIDPAFMLSKRILLDDVWHMAESISLKSMEMLMYVSYCGNKKNYLEFISSNIESILKYLKHRTESHRLYVDKEKKEIHAEYILKSDMKSVANEQSVSRLKSICRMLPIYEYYCADAIKPSIRVLSSYRLPDDAHKKMPLKNLVIMFHQDMTSLWRQTIRSNFEYYTVNEWVEYWFNVRKQVCLLADNWYECMVKILSERNLGGTAKESDSLFISYSKSIICEKLFPGEDKPFEDCKGIGERMASIKNDYFWGVYNFGCQFVGFLSRKENEQRLAGINLLAFQSSLNEMQTLFGEMAEKYDYQNEHIKLCSNENISLGNLGMACEYYKSHTPERCFNKYQIKKYYDIFCKTEMDTAQKALAELRNEFDVVFPNKIYTKGVLRYYPIIISERAIADGKSIETFLMEAIYFADAPFEYLNILLLDDDKRIERKALQISRDTFRGIKSIVNADGEFSVEKLIPPYPSDVSQQVLDCFNDIYCLAEERINDARSMPAGDILEELWIYSKLEELLAESDDKEYYLREIEHTRKIINGSLDTLKAHYDKDSFDMISEVCEKVFGGVKFDDDFYNTLLESIS